MKKKTKKHVKTTMAAAIAVGSVVAVAPMATQASVQFTDVKVTDYYYEDVLQLAARGVVNGFSDGTFKPKQDVTRGQAAKIIAGVLGLDTTNVSNPGFKDVTTSNQYYGAIAALANAGIINGYEDGTFRPGDAVQRNHMAKIIAGAFKLEAPADFKTPLKDVRADYAQYVTALYSAGVTTGKTATTFDGSSNVTRGQLASFVVRAENADNTTAPVVKDVTLTISQVDGSKVEGYTISTALQGLLNEANNAALAGAVVSAKVLDDEIVGINSLQLNAPGTEGAFVTLEGGNSTIAGDLVVNADYVEVKNVTVQGNVSLSNSVKSEFFADGLINDGDFIVEEVNSSVASLTPFFANTTKGLKIGFKNSNLKSVHVKRDNVSIASNVKLPELTVSAAVSKIQVDADVAKFKVDVTVNIAISGAGSFDEVALEKAVEVALNIVGNIAKLVVNSTDAKVNIAASIKIGEVTLPANTTAAGIIKNYESIKGNIDKVVSDNTTTTPPVSGGSGSSGGGSGSGGSNPGVDTPVTVTSISPITDTAIVNKAYTLPIKVTVTLSNGQTDTRSVTWTAPEDIKIIDGKVTFTESKKDAIFLGTVAGTSIKAKLILTAITEDEAKEVVSVKAISPITLANGAEVNDALPATVEATTASGDSISLNIEWTTPEGFDSTQAGEYTFEGKLSSGNTNVVIPSELAKVTVVVTVEAADVADKAAAEAVSNQIANLPEDKDILTSSQQIVDTQKAYTKLTDVQKELVSNEDKEKLKAVVGKFVSFAKADINGLNVAVANEANIEEKQNLVNAAKANLSFAKELGLDVSEAAHYQEMIDSAQKQVDSATEEEADKGDKAAAEAVSNQIANLPEDKDILTSSQQIVDTQKAYTKLTDVQKELVSNEDKEKLKAVVGKFVSFAKADINGLNVAVANEANIEEKQNLVNAAKANLSFAKELGLDVSEAAHYQEMIDSAQKQVDSATEEEADKGDKAAAEAVSNQIANLPTDKDILISGQQIVDTQKAYTKLTDVQKELVSNEDKEKLKAVVGKFVSFAKADINGLNVAVANEANIEEKQNLVNAAKANLSFAKELGLDVSEAAHYQEMIDSAQKQVDSATEEEADKGDKAAAEAVSNQIANLPADKDILISGQQIVDTQKAYTKLTDVQKELVSNEDKEKLKAVVGKFVSFAKADINGLNVAVANEANIEEKQNLVNAAKANLSFAKELGLDVSEAAHYQEMIDSAQKQVDSATEEEADKGDKAAAEAVSNQIANLPTDKDILISGQQIVDTQKAYTKLTDVQKELVSNEDKEKLKAVVGKFVSFAKADINGLNVAVANEANIEEKQNLVNAAKANLSFAKELGLDVSEAAHYQEMIDSAQKQVDSATEEEADKGDKAAAEAVSNQIANLPTDKDILISGQQIVDTQKAYTKLTDVQKELVSNEDKEKLKAVVGKFVSFAKADINGLNVAVANEANIEEKQNLVNAAKANLSFAKELGLDVSEAAHYQEMIDSAQKQVDSATEEEADKGDKAAAEAVSNQIANLPADKDILISGQQIVDTQKAYTELTDVQKDLVSNGDKDKLKAVVGKFVSFAKADISGLNVAVANEANIEEKQNLVNAAKANLSFAKELGLDVSEAAHYQEMIDSAQKQVDSATEEEADKGDKAAAEAVSNQIANLPTDKDILISGQQIVDTQKAYTKLTDVQKELVSNEDKEKLKAVVGKFVSFAKADINGLNVAVANEANIEEKQNLVNAAKANLSFAKELGLDVSEAAHYQEMIDSAQKQVDSATEEEADKGDKAAAEAVSNQIANLPADKDILISGQQIVDTQKAYTELTDVQKDLVSNGDKDKLKAVVGKFVSFAKADISGLNVAVANEANIEEKQNLVNAAKANLSFAKELGLDVSEATHYQGMIDSAQKQVDSATEEETGQADKAAAEAVSNQIANLPTDKDILISGQQIVDTQKAYTKLTDVQKELVSNEDKEKLKAVVGKFVSFAKADINGLNVAVANEANIEEKQNLVNAAKANLEFAKVLGLNDSEATHYQGMIDSAQKQVDSAKQEEADKGDKAAAEAVSNQIANLPEDKDILTSGQQIVDTQKAYTELTDAQKALLSDADKKALADTVKDFISFTKADISGLNVKVAMESDIVKKQALVDAAKANLEIAKKLGFSGGEYTMAETQVADAQKQIPVFTSSTNIDTANTVDILGIIGTIASSSDEQTVTVAIIDGKVAITSKKVGTALITVTDDSQNAATIEVTVKDNGDIQLGEIKKYIPQ